MKKYVDNYPPPLEFIPECFMTREMCDNAVNGWFFVFNSIPNWYKTLEMRNRALFEDPFLIVYCLNKYIIQRLCDKAADDSLEALKVIPNLFVTSKTFYCFASRWNMPFFNEDSGSVVFF